jgi:hypothetical protein
MPRPRKNDPSSLLNPILSQFAARIAQAVERFTIARIEKAVKEQSRAVKARRGRGGLRTPARCYFPGCKNIAAPRFGMFCVALHRNLSKTEKERYRAAHMAQKAKARNGNKEKARGNGRATAVAPRRGRRAKSKRA